VEVDPETACVRILRYVSVHDAGTVINPAIAEGQIYGGALHGHRGALWEELQYDPAGQCLTATLMTTRSRARPRRRRSTSCTCLALTAHAARLEGSRGIERHDRARGDRQRGQRRARAGSAFASASCP